MKFAQDFIERVRESTNIVGVIAQYVQLRQSGSNHMGLCPFHHEKSPSFSVSEDKQVYFCFGCKATGNVFGFVQQYQGLTFPETIEYLAKRSGIPIPVNPAEGGDRTRDLKALLKRINGLASKFYHQKLKALPEGHEVRAYLKTRGLSDDLVDTYKLGYAPDAWTELADFFSSKRVPVPEAEQLGLIKRRGQDKSGHYDLFRHRLMFPIYSPTGECLGFGGRVFTKDQQPKYLNSPDAPIFHKGKVFYGLDHAAKFIRSADEAIVVEGYMDWLALAKVSIGNIVATLGTALTPDHARAIKRYTNRVLLLFDGDQAGRSAARRSLPILLAEGILARGLFLPDELDPDEFIEARGEAALRQLIAGAPDLFELVSTEQWLLAKGTPTGKIQLLDEFAPVLMRVADPRLRRLYSENFANMVGVDIQLVEQSIGRAVAGSTHAGSAIRALAAPVPGPNGRTAGGPGTGHGTGLGPGAGPTAGNTATATASAEPAASAVPAERIMVDLAKAPKSEVELLNVIQLQEVYLKEALSSGVVDQLAHPGCKAIFQRIAEVYGRMPNKFDTLSALLADEVRPVETITRHLADPYTSLTKDGGLKLLQDCIKRVKSNFLKSKSREMVSSLRGTGEVNPSAQLEQIMNIQKSRRSLSRES